MSRFFKSAAFPILIVVVLAFFAQKLISPGTTEKSVSYSDFVTQLGQGRVKTVELRTKDSTAKVETVDDKRYEVGFLEGDAASRLETQLADAKAEGKLQEFDIKGAQDERLGQRAHLPAAVPALHRPVDLPHELRAGRRLEGHAVRQVQGQAALRRLPEDHLPGRRGRRRGRRGAPRDQGVPREPEEVPGARGPDPEGRAALRAPRHGQDAARARRRRRGGRPVLLHLGLGLRRDVRRGRCLPRARPLRAGQAELALHHLHGRDRRRRPPPRRRHGRRARRARADAQPAPGRDGRLHLDGQHHHDRGHEPARHPRPRAPAPGPLRPPDRRGPPGPQGPRAHPRRPHARQAAGEGDRHGHPRGPDAGLHGRGPREPRQRGGAALRPHGQEGDRPGRARGGDHARDRRSREEDAGDGGEGAPHHGLPRDGPRARRPLPRALRPGPQDLRRLPRPGPGLHDLHAAGGQVPHHARGAPGLHRDDPRRSRGGGDRLQRDHHGRLERPREGHRAPRSRWSCASA